MINKYVAVLIILLCVLYLKIIKIKIIENNPILLVLLFITLIILNYSDIYGYILLLCFIYYGYILDKKKISGGSSDIVMKTATSMLKGFMPLGGKILETFSNLGYSNNTETAEKSNVKVHKKVGSNDLNHNENSEEDEDSEEDDDSDEDDDDSDEDDDDSDEDDDDDDEDSD